MSCGRRRLGEAGGFAEVGTEAVWTSTSRQLPPTLSQPQSGTETFSSSPSFSFYFFLKLLLVPKLHIRVPKADRIVCFESCRSLLW